MELTYKRLEVNIVDSPIPIPKDGGVLICVVVSGSNPKDWKQVVYNGKPANSGDDIAGIVEVVGANVVEFKPCDRVGAFHEMYTPHGAFAEYAIAWASTTFHIPSNITFGEAAAVPLAGMTAAPGMYRYLGIPHPWMVEDDSPNAGPIVVYGVGSAVGAYAVQLARKSGTYSIICVAGQSKAHVETLIDRNKGDTIIDYRAGPEAVVAEIKKALGGKPDQILGAVLNPKGGKMAIVLPKSGAKISKIFLKGIPEGYVLPAVEGVPKSVEVYATYVGSVHGEDKHFGFLFFRYLALGLEEGWFKAHPQEVVPGGLGGIPQGLKNLRAGKAHSVFVRKVLEHSAPAEFLNKLTSLSVDAALGTALQNSKEELRKIIVDKNPTPNDL
ncbi:GroES-like protein [Zopfia rhizophila CBS 207.26]|uniref:GroES-like protein n=1 Tax=Zopfia rhizophila CBS 207.26 TaxID=1314779 RepID=A0A6A6DY84_9PEZI|nr:GroES-like protein [Zopfia rhizophila CBS 207.26]